MRRRRLRFLIPVAALVVLLAGAGFARLEGDIVSSYWEGLLWALSLMTTVGFVGETPETTAGKALAAFLMVFGFAGLALTTAAIASLFVRGDEAPEEDREHDFERQLLAELDDLRARLKRIEASGKRPPDA